MHWNSNELAAFLRGQTADQVTCTFPQIEALLGAPLPTSAQEAWWWIATPEMLHVPAGAWLRAGWRVQAVKPSRREVTFVREDTSTP